MQGLTRLAAAQQKAAEHDETKKDLQREMIVNRLRTSSEKQKYKQAIDEARAVCTLLFSLLLLLCRLLASPCSYWEGGCHVVGVV